MQYLVSLYEEGTVTRAAKRLNVVQPAISMQLSKLEEEFGQHLFSRTPKGMIPTPAGHEAYRRFLPILRDLADARQQLAAMRGEIVGHISLGVIASVSNNALSECIASFHEKHPRVTVHATGGYTISLMEMVRSGELDLAVINRPGGRMRLTSVEIVSEELFLICAARTHLPRQGAFSIEDISKMNLIMPSRRHGLRTIIDDVANEAGLRLTPSMEFDELQAIEDFISMTDFVTILPPITVHRALKAGLLKNHPIRPTVTRRIVCVHNPQRPVTQAAKLLIAEFQGRMQAALDSSLTSTIERATTDVS